MYKCSMDGNNHDGEPALKNACGTFCPECKAKIHAKAAEGVKERIESLNGCCIWCGEKITEANPSGKSHEGCNIHETCEQKRDWVLKCIRHSDKMAKYVARTEERERPMREEREKAKRSAEQPTMAETVPTEQEARLRRVELMLNKLVNSLGV